MIIEIRDEVVTLGGTLTKNQWAAVESALAMRLRHHPAGVILDLGGLTLVSPEGAQTFRDAVSHASRVVPGARLVLANVPANVARVLRGSGGLGSSLAVASTVAEARASLNAAQTLMDQAGGTQTTKSAANSDRAGTRRPEVIVALLGSDADGHAVAVGCRLAGAIPSDPRTREPVSRMHLAHVLIVPRDRSLLAPMEAEESAVKRLAQLAASVKANGCVGSVVTQIERTRDGGIRLADLASELRAEFLVLALGTNASSEDVSLARYVVERAPCEVIVNRVPMANLRGEKPAILAMKEQKNVH